ncbi:MAG: hypothetical protein COA38_19510 [Fluviicola sp.]|nr:MAG: hypothetical protein COA38_19510 [Fluviicola sp.]
MKNVVLKIPTAIFIALIFLPFMILVLQIVSREELMEAESYQVLSIVGSITSSIWLFSIVDYFQSKTPAFKFLRLIYILLIVDSAFILLDIFEITGSDRTTQILLFVAHSVVYITAMVFIILLIRKVFYERSVWFIVLEVIILVIGIMTLTPEIKKHEKELQASSLEGITK